VKGVSAAALSSPASPLLANAQGGDPIRIGLLAAKTGPLASGGIDMERAMQLFLRDRANMIAGHPIELTTLDTAGVPATARTKAQELIEKNKIHCLIGPLAAFEALAIADYVTQSQTPTIGLPPPKT